MPAELQAAIRLVLAKAESNIANFKDTEEVDSLSLVEENLGEIHDLTELPAEPQRLEIWALTVDAKGLGLVTSLHPSEDLAYTDLIQTFGDTLFHDAADLEQAKNMLASENLVGLKEHLDAAFASVSRNQYHIGSITYTVPPPVSRQYSFADGDTRWEVNAFTKPDVKTAAGVVLEPYHVCLTAHTYDAWFEKFKPVQNQLNKNAPFDGCLYETFGSEVDFVFATFKSTPEKVWTLGECDGVQYISHGYHLANRLGYFITEFAKTDDDNVEEYTVFVDPPEPDEDDEDDEVANPEDLLDAQDPDMGDCGSDAD